MWKNTLRWIITVIVLTLLAALSLVSAASANPYTEPPVSITDADARAELDATAFPVPPLTPLPNYLIGTQGRVIIVRLSEFRAFAYEDGQLVHSSIINSGRFNMATLTGSFTVQRKIELSDMTYRGNTVEDVPYILVYEGSFAIHGAYWHEEWGVRASSGCVNLPVNEAEWFYNFAYVGTPVHVLP